VNTRVHVLLLVVTVVSILFIVRLVRHNRLPARYAVLWLAVGAGLLLLAAFPGVIEPVSHWLGIEYAPATVFLGAITLLFLMVVHFSWEVSRLEARTRILAQELALLRAATPDRRLRSTDPEDEAVDS
jgi:hypothetical protein